MGVSKIIVHQNFNRSISADNDIAILQLSSDLKLGGIQAKAVSLPDSGSDPLEGEDVMVAGWGLMNENDTNDSYNQRADNKHAKYSEKST